MSTNQDKREDDVSTNIQQPNAAEHRYGTSLTIALDPTGYETGQSDPNWFDVVRPTKLPSVKEEFGKDCRYFAGVRQSRLGFKGYMPTSAGPIKTIFEFDMFGTGVDAGQTTIRLRHAWGELGKFGAGQTWSPFMDIDAFPNSVEYWGPNGMVFYRNVQVRYTPWSGGDSNLMIAIERPGGSGDHGIYGISLSSLSSRFPAPDISAHYRLAGEKGHIQVAGIYRRLNWDDMNATPTLDLTGSANGWGINVSSNVKLKTNVLRLQYVYGEGIENYMNDAPSDIAVQTNPSSTLSPLVGKALPVSGLVAFYDLNWSEKWTTTLGYSRVDIDNTDGQANTAFKSGQYALTNILYYPVKGVMLGPEVQWGYRDNKQGFHVADYKFQFSAKYNFNFKVGG
jgi:hypothetical protein